MTATAHSHDSSDYGISVNPDFVKLHSHQPNSIIPLGQMLSVFGLAVKPEVYSFKVWTFGRRRISTNT